MLDSIMKLIIGDLNEKRAYKQLMKRVNALPEEYRYTFRKIQHYMFSVGPPGGDMTVFTDLTMFTDLVELLETSAAEGKPVLEITGSDVARFCDEFMRASGSHHEAPQKKLNQEIMDKFNKNGE